MFFKRENGALRTVADQYKLDDKHTACGDLQKVIDLSTRTIEEWQVPLTYVTQPELADRSVERGLLMLSTADQSIIKTQNHPPSEQIGSLLYAYDGLALKIPPTPNLNIVTLIPERPKNHSIERQDIDTDRSQETKSRIDDWNPNSLLSQSRTILRINPDNEKNCQTIVVKQDTPSFKKKYGCEAFHKRVATDRGVIVLPSDTLNESNQWKIKHEYTHSQGANMTREFPIGHWCWGLNEVVTALLTPNDPSYPGPRAALAPLFENPWAKHIKEYYITGDPSHRFEFFKNLAQQYGLDGVYHVSRINPRTKFDPKKEYPYKTITAPELHTDFIDGYQVHRVLTK